MWEAQSDARVARAISKWAIWQAQTNEGVAWAIPKWAPRHSKSDLTCPKWWEGCARDLQMSTAPQRERSERPKVTRRATVSCETSFENRRWRIFCVVRLRVTIFAGHGSQAQVLCKSAVKNGRRRGYFCAVRVIKNGAHLWDHLDTPPNPWRTKRD